VVMKVGYSIPPEPPALQGARDVIMREARKFRKLRGHYTENYRVPGTPYITHDNN
jgi:hypothetical protein